MSPAPRLLRLLLAFLFVIAACGDGDEAERDLDAILESDTLVALTTYNSTSYFIYRGEPMGFEHELLRSFADGHDVALRVDVVRDRGRLWDMLRAGDGDIAAARLVPETTDTPFVAFTAGLYRTRPAVVQRPNGPGEAELPEAVDTVMELGEPADTVTLRARLIRAPGDLAGDTVTLPEGSRYIDRLVELSDSLTGDIHVVEVDPDVKTEALIRRVARGEVALTVSQSNLARLNASQYANVVVRPSVGPEHRVAWAARRNSPELVAALNEWIRREETQELIGGLYQKYFIDRRAYSERQAGTLDAERGRLSEYDDLLRRHAPAIGWPWELLAAQTFQESRFDPGARSWAGAMGLLQLMPGTAREVEVSDPFDPEQNVAGGVRYLRNLLEQWEKDIADPDERLRFVLASYNAGRGHVQDAQRLAEKNGDDPTAWEDVAFWLLQKSKRSVYTDPVVKYGFARGMEPVTYVARILDRYGHYRESLPDGEAVSD